MGTVARRIGKSSAPILLLVVPCTACNETESRPTSLTAGGDDVATPVASASASAASVADSRPMMIEFTRDFCLPCQVMAPSVEELKRAHAERVDVVALNIDREHNRQFAEFFRIRSVPTLVFVDASGRIAKRSEGLAMRPQMEESLRTLGWIE